jgi:glycosyltransferase involved in cell wall biosynthesis
MQEKKSLVYIISNIDKALAFEWLATSETLRQSFGIRFILLGAQPGQLYHFLVARGIDAYYIHYRGKSDIPAVLLKIYRYLKANRIRLVHTHLFDASLIGLLAARLAGVPKRIHTRHHATLHHQYFPRAVYYDKGINLLSTHIVAISSLVAGVLEQQEEVAPAKIRLIAHGFRLEQFSEVSGERIDAVAMRHGIKREAYPKVGVISRYTHWKGIQHIIPAFARLRQQYPEAQLILANAKGDYQEQIRAQLAELPQNSYTEIPFEQDVPALYQLFDLYVHAPIDEHSEAFGQTYVEALAAGVPSVFTPSGVAPEYIRHEDNALLVPFQDAKAIYTALLRLLEDAELRQKIRAQGRQDVAALFTFEAMEKKLMALYTEA